MNRLIQSCAAIALASMLATGCAHLPGKCDLGKVAKDAQLTNVTTGDGTFENYQATGYYTSTEIGFAVGIPGIKFMELFPMQDDTAQMTQIAKDAKSAGATAVINARPPKGMYTGLPFIFIGLYVDSAAGTGIKSK
jgi:hypothetical protein